MKKFKETDKTSHMGFGIQINFGRGIMKTQMSVKSILAAGLLVLGLGVMSQVQAANPDTMTISVTPSVTYAVAITSVNGSGYTFGTVALAASTISTSAIVVTNTGTISEYFAMAVSNTNPDNWAAGASGTPGANTFGLIGYFNATQPANATFVGTDALTNSVPGTSDSLYGQASTKTNVAGTKNLWLKLNMPTTLSVGSGGAQTMVLSINGQAS